MFPTKPISPLILGFQINTIISLWLCIKRLKNNPNDDMYILVFPSLLDASNYSSKLHHCSLPIHLKLNFILEFKIVSAGYCFSLWFLQHLSKLDTLHTCFSRSLMRVLNKAGPSPNPCGTLLDTCSNLIFHHLSLLMFAVLQSICSWPNNRNTMILDKAGCVNVFTFLGPNTTDSQAKGGFLYVSCWESFQ